MGAIKNLAIIGGIGLAVNEISKASKSTSRSANTSAAGVTVKNVIEADKVAQIIAADANLLALVKGAKGDKGDNGLNWKGAYNNATAYALNDAVTSSGSSYRCKLAHTNQPVTNLTYWELIAQKGETGATGAPAAQNFGQSLITNGAAELGDISFWGNGTTLGDVFEGTDSLVLTYDATRHIYNSTIVNIENRRLYKIHCFAKGTVSFGFYLARLNKSLANIIQENTNFVYALGSAMFSNANFEEKTIYFGGVADTIRTSFGLNAAKTKLSVYATGAGVVTVNKLTLQQVPLCEPVPYNLAYLPNGQMVYDPTTGELGRFNGTSVVWS